MYKSLYISDTNVLYMLANLTSPIRQSHIYYYFFFYSSYYLIIKSVQSPIKNIEEPWVYYFDAYNTFNADQFWIHWTHCSKQ